MLILRPSLLAATSGPLLIGVWRAIPPRAEDVAVCMPPLLQYAKSRRQTALVAIIHPDAPSPSADVRRQVVDEMRKLDPYVVGGATVVTRDGFAGSAIRAIISTLQLLSMPRHPERIFATTKEAGRFLNRVLAGHLEDAPSAEEITDACDEMTRKAWSSEASSS